jgi:alpha-tubulin suppressor-like RCC1 family protein
MALAITAGSAHSCARLVSGSVKCWGYGYFGQLGRGSRDNAIDAAMAIDLGIGRTATMISAGQYHTCALLDDGSIKCWGANEFGQLGQGDTANRGDEPGEMGNTLPAIAFGGGIKASLIASGAGHVCATLEDGTMKCWGAGHFGQLGIGDDNNQGDNPGEMALLPAVAFGVQEKVMALSLGGTHSCARLEYGSLRCFGRGNHGQLGQGTPNWIGNTPGDIANLIPIDLDTDDVPVAFVAGTDHTCAALTEGRVKCWGRNDQGQLGLGDVEARGDEMDEMGTLLPAVQLW